MSEQSGNVVVPVAPGFVVEQHELDTAWRLAAAGHVVEFLVPSKVEGVKTPDVLIDGVAWEMKSPAGATKNTVWHQLSRALKQCDRIVLDTSRTVLSDDYVIREVRNRCERAPGIAEVWVVTKDGSVVQVQRQTVSSS